MFSKMTVLMILMLTISSVSVCSLKVGNAQSRADSENAETENQNGRIWFESFHNFSPS